MGKSGSFLKVLESGREGAEQEGAYGLVKGLQRGFAGSPKPKPPSAPGAPAKADAPRMAGDAVSAVTEGREYRNLGKARFRRDP